MTKNGLLFDISPIEDEDSKKKKPSKRKNSDDEVSLAPSQTDYMSGYSPGYMLSLDSVPCETCGAPADLVEIKKIDGKTQWIVMCGWWCMHRWHIDPIPGLIETEEAEEKPEEFVLRDGMFAGKTFSEIRDLGRMDYLKSLPKLARRSAVAEAAADWLAKNP